MTNPYNFCLETSLDFQIYFSNIEVTSIRLLFGSAKNLLIGELYSLLNNRHKQSLLLVTQKEKLCSKKIIGHKYNEFDWLVRESRIQRGDIC